MLPHSALTWSQRNIVVWSHKGEEMGIPLRRWTFYHLHSQYVIIFKVIWYIALKQSGLLTSSTLISEFVAFVHDLVHLVLLLNVAASSLTYCYKASSWLNCRFFQFILIAWMNLEGLCKCSYGYQEQDMTSTPPLKINVSYNILFFCVYFWCIESVYTIGHM